MAHPGTVKALAVVAHHDDHLLWMGGTILRTSRSGWEWTLVALCVPEAIKQGFFCNFCKATGVNGQFYCHADYMTPPARNTQGAMRADLLKSLGSSKFNWIFTHSRRTDYPGREYGDHANHAEVEELVTSLVKEEIVGEGMRSLAYFNYELLYGGPGSGVPTVARYKPGSYYLSLKYPELHFKSKWAVEIPDDLGGIDYPCPNPESFEGDDLVLPDTIFRKPALKDFKR